MSAEPSETVRGLRSSYRRVLATVVASVSCAACAASGSASTAPATESPRPDAPLVAAQPGAWFDNQGGLLVVGSGKRLRLRLSAPVVACGPVFQSDLPASEQAARASLTFRVLSERCREQHPAILLEEESSTASPAELERSHHEVARCAAQDLGATSGWVPAVVAASDPCPTALGVGWRLPSVAELQGLTVDDRKAVAGALFEAEPEAGFGSLLLYARAASGQLTLVTLSPNGSEQAPVLTEAKLAKPFFGAALRCVGPIGLDSAAPPLPHARECIDTLRREQAAFKVRPAAAPAVEVQKLKAWVDAADATPLLLVSELALRELTTVLASPAIDRLAREAREERSLTEHYAELAESVDDPNLSLSERQRRRAEFDNLRRRLGGQIAATATSGSDRTQLDALLTRLTTVLDQARAAKPSKKVPRAKTPDYGPLLARLHELRGDKSVSP